MGIIRLSKAEKDLVAAIEHGDRIDFKNREKIRAEVLRHIVLGLPLFRKGIRPRARKLPCVTTGAGVRIGGAVITGRLCLDAAIGEEGGPICPLDFRDCHFDLGKNEPAAGLTIGFSGANAHFACLGFRDCRFNDRERVAANGTVGAPSPTIELSGAKIDSNLDMQRIRPLGDGGGQIPPAGQLPFLWVRAIGTRIDGNLDLCRAHLSAPDDDRSKRVLAEPPILPLNLSLAKICGDFLFLSGSRSQGTINARCVQVDGDVWMSGARICCRRDDKRALFFQMASIGGALMLDGRHEKVDESGRFFPFKADGELNLFAIRVGGAIVMNDVEISAKDVCLDLTGARVGGRVEIGTEHHPQQSILQGRIQFDRMEVDTSVMIKNVRLGHSEPPAPRRHTLDARALVARQFVIADVHPIAGTGGPQGDESLPRFLSVTLRDARFERLVIADSLIGPLDASPVHCAGDVRLHAVIEGNVNLAGATIAGSLDISRLCIDGENRRLSLNGATVGRALCLSPCELPGSRAPLADRDPALGCLKFRLNGTVDLQGMRCDMLDDGIGRCWGGEARILMNQFTYRQTGWLVPGETDDKASAGKRSNRIVGDWLLAKRADGRWPWSWVRDSERLQDHDYWQPWQLRRNWIYQQFGKPKEAPVSISRHRIEERDYRPQPFEQAIRVARSEGREDFATHFEMLKQRIEWGFFNEQVRWWLAFVGIILASGWLLLDHGQEVSRWARGGTVIALMVTSGAILRASTVHAGVCRLFRLEEGIESRFLTRVFFFVPAAFLLFFTDWWYEPFHFLIAFLIFVTIRFASVLVHGVMRFGFGYMRRPIQAFLTLIVAFLVGWWGVVIANGRDMLVINAAPVAAVAGRHRPEHPAVEHGQEQRPASADNSGEDRREESTPVAQLPPVLMGSEGVGTGEAFHRELSCRPEISEPLYALDVLIPLVDLGEESRCEIRRLPVGRTVHSPGGMSIYEMRDNFPDLPLDDHRFWWWMKALYAIAGWFIVSLALLTFAQVNRTRGEPAEED